MKNQCLSEVSFQDNLSKNLIIIVVPLREKQVEVLRMTKILIEHRIID